MRWAVIALLLLTGPAWAQSTIEQLSPIPTFPLPDPANTPSHLWITQGCSTPQACDYKISPTQLGYIYQGTIAPLTPFQNQLWWNTGTSPPTLEAYQGTTWGSFPNVTGFAPVNSPAFTGTPTAPTAPVGTNTSQVATTAFVAASQRTRLTSNLTVYVGPAGVDVGNNCLVQLTPCATAQYAYNLLLANYDLNGSATVTIQLLDGLYTTAFVDTQALVGQAGPNNLILQGDTANYDNVTINAAAVVPPGSGSGAAVTAAYTGQFTVAFLKVQSTGSGLFAYRSGVLQYHDIDFGVVTTNHVFANQHGEAYSVGNNVISGGANAHVEAIAQAQVLPGDASLVRTLTLSGTPAFSGAFAVAGDAGLVFAPNITFIGSAAGNRCIISGNSVVDTFGGGATYFPGSVSCSGGAITTGGQLL